MSGKRLKKLTARGRRHKRAQRPIGIDDVFRLVDEVPDFKPGDQFILNGTLYEIPRS